MTAKDILKELQQLGNKNTKETFAKHGAKGSFYGVRIADLKKFQKVIKKNYELSLELYDTGNADAMYLAGLIADENKMTKKDLQKWVKEANWEMISEYTVAWIGAESKFGMELASEWIQSDKENIASSGWATLSSLVSITPDDELDFKVLEKYLAKAGKEIHTSQNRVRYTMNGYVIAVAAFVAPLTLKALQVAEKIGKVKVDMGGTACKVPNAVAYIERMKSKGKIGNKRKMARC